MIDVAVNIFAKPFQTALSLLSLLERCGQHIGTIWLQFEPQGSMHDPIPPYPIAWYLEETLGKERVRVFQPEAWLARQVPDPTRMHDPTYRMGIRYQYALENCASDKLLLIHNDVFILKDLVAPMLEQMGDAFAIGQLGQCWNCPAANADLVGEVMGCPPCSPQTYEAFQPDFASLQALYALARKRGIFVRPYDLPFAPEFETHPWPLPECRVSEWACLLNLREARKHCVPNGPVPGPGAFGQCGETFLDTAVPWFRGMHQLGYHARHFDTKPYMKHWVGTGKKRPHAYALAEDNALGILRKHYPQWLVWLKGRTGKDFTR